MFIFIHFLFHWFFTIFEIRSLNNQHENLSWLLFLMGTDSHLLLGTSYFVILRAMAWPECKRFASRSGQRTQREVNMKLIERSICLGHSSHSDCFSGRRTLQSWEPLSWFRDHNDLSWWWRARKQIPIAVSQLCATYILLYVGNSEQLLCFTPQVGPGPPYDTPVPGYLNKHRQHHAPWSASGAPMTLTSETVSTAWASCL